MSDKKPGRLSSRESNLALAPKEITEETTLRELGLILRAEDLLVLKVEIRGAYCVASSHTDTAPGMTVAGAINALLQRHRQYRGRKG